MRKPLIPLLALAAGLSACTHLGTNISGKFSCRAPASDCQPVSVIDAKATAELGKVQDDMLGLPQKQRVGVVSSDNARTSERTLRIVLPAHVDSSGVLHDEAVAWAVVEAPRWAGELRRAEEAPRKSSYSALRQALKDAARRASASAPVNPEHLPPEDSAPASPSTSPFVPAAPLVLPSPGGAADTGPRLPPVAAPGAEGAFPLPLPQDRSPRPLSEQRVWPPASAIQKALQAVKDQAEQAKDDAGKAETGKTPIGQDEDHR